MLTLETLLIKLSCQQNNAFQNDDPSTLEARDYDVTDDGHAIIQLNYLRFTTWNIRP
jgi:hypothetical protein